MSSSISASEQRARLRGGLTSGARRSLAAMAVAAVLAPILYVLLLLFQLGSWHGADWWLRDIITLRRALYADILRDMPPEASKTLIVAGSGSLFGVDGGLITEATGTETLGFGLHAGLDLDLLLAQASRSIDANDKVVMPLEFELYHRLRPTDLTAANFLAYFYKDAGAIPPRHLPALFLAAKPVTVVEGAVDRIAALFGKRTDFIVDEATILQRWREAQSDQAELQSRSSYYDYYNLNAHGDKILVRLTPESAEAEGSTFRSGMADAISPYTAEMLADWRADLAKRGATLFLTWPVMLEDDVGTIVTEQHWQRLIDFARDAEAKGEPLYCDPVAAVIPVQYRFDSAYHLNYKGSLLYSAGLADCLKDIAAKPFDWRNANAAALADAARQRLAALKSPPDPLIFGYERNIRQLQALHAAIEATHVATGRYPEALPPVGPVLPVMKTVAAPFAPTYRSDGTDFALTVAGKGECYTVREGWPQMIHPQAPAEGGCRYGFWSPGAANW